jgi:hypothetical protein
LDLAPSNPAAGLSGLSALLMEHCPRRVEDIDVFILVGS